MWNDKWKERWTWRMWFSFPAKQMTFLGQGPCLYHHDGDENPLLLDLNSNGWGEKFECSAGQCYQQTALQIGNCVKGEYGDRLQFCTGRGFDRKRRERKYPDDRILSAGFHRNQPLNKMDIEERLKISSVRSDSLAEAWPSVRWRYGRTHRHSARFCPNDTIAYVQCTDKNDGHYEELLKMEEELEGIKDTG